MPLIFVPVILRILGSENYGLVAFFSMLISLVGLLDAGIGSTFIKLVSTNRFNELKFKQVLAIFSKVCVFFLFVSLSVIAAFYFQANYIAEKWLNTTIEYDTVIACMKLIGMILGGMYLKSFLSSFINGMERQELNAIWGVFYTSFFYIGSYFALKYVSNNLVTFFQTILLVTLFDLLITILIMLYLSIKNIKYLEKNTKSGYEYENDEKLSFLNIIKFSLQLSGLSTIWVIASQIDKIVLSKYVQLSDYAHYQIAAQLAATITIFTIPLTQYLLPRLSVLFHDGRFDDFINIFSKSLLAYVIIVSPIIPFFFIFGDQLITLWVGSAELAVHINIYAQWLVGGAFFVGLINFVFICLYAQDKLKQHFYAYATYSAVAIPLSVLVAKFYGASYSALFVFSHSLLFWIAWGGFYFFRNIPGLIIPFIIIIVATLGISLIVFNGWYQLMSLLMLPLIYVIVAPVINLLISMVIFYSFRMKFKKTLRRIKFQS
ncbi:Membrane protein involved in the export of O-antigen and teichoic acid [Kosakonia sacchari]|uniref:Membrane protein involved in the export of O-antigen and teichoic acid n=3 Tax=Kosakonia sacchari TaxID=1158459 RepID=A0A1G4YI43_9ENTR|nr:Membrane protein involved in the export of O-antigen and teichoic acid [Kosakonia sacchari]